MQIQTEVAPNQPQNGLLVTVPAPFPKGGNSPDDEENSESKKRQTVLRQGWTPPALGDCCRWRRNRSGGSIPSAPKLLLCKTSCAARVTDGVRPRPECEAVRQVQGDMVGNGKGFVDIVYCMFR